MNNCVDLLTRRKRRKFCLLQRWVNSTLVKACCSKCFNSFVTKPEQLSLPFDKLLWFESLLLLCNDSIKSLQTYLIQLTISFFLLGFSRIPTEIISDSFVTLFKCNSTEISSKKWFDAFFVASVLTKIIRWSKLIFYCLDIRCLPTRLFR